MRHAILYRFSPSYRRRVDRIFDLRWELWFHALRVQGLARAVSVAPKSPVWESDIAALMAEGATLTAELDSLRGAK